MSKTYTTVQGDMWDSIAYDQLGDMGYTDKLMRLNQQYLEYFIFPAGITLVLPDENRTVGNPLPPWKAVPG